MLYMEGTPLNPISCTLFWYVWVRVRARTVPAPNYMQINSESVSNQWVENPLNKPRWDHLDHQLHNLVEKRQAVYYNVISYVSWWSKPFDRSYVSTSEVTIHMIHFKQLFIVGSSKLHWSHDSGLVSMFSIHSSLQYLTSISFCLHEM